MFLVVFFFFYGGCIFYGVVELFVVFFLVVVVVRLYGFKVLVVLFVFVVGGFFASVEFVLVLVLGWFRVIVEGRRLYSLSIVVENDRVIIRYDSF